MNSAISDITFNPAYDKLSWVLKWTVAFAVAAGVILGFIFAIGYLIKPMPFTQNPKPSRTSLEMVHLVPAPTTIEQAPTAMTTPVAAAPPPIETDAIEIPITDIPRNLNTPEASTLPTFTPSLSSQFALPSSAPQNRAPVAQALPALAPSTLGASTAAAPLVRLNPTYPPRALRRGVEGFVKVEIHIDVDGSVKSARVLDSQPPRLFDRSALRAVRQWQFRPTMRNGKAIEQISLQTIDFKLDN